MQIHSLFQDIAEHKAYKEISDMSSKQLQLKQRRQLLAMSFFHYIYAHTHFCFLCTHMRFFLYSSSSYYRIRILLSFLLSLEKQAFRLAKDHHKPSLIF